MLQPEIMWNSLKYWSTDRQVSTTYNYFNCTQEKFWYILGQKKLSLKVICKYKIPNSTFFTIRKNYFNSKTGDTAIQLQTGITIAPTGALINYHSILKIKFLQSFLNSLNPLAFQIICASVQGIRRSFTLSHKVPMKAPACVFIQSPTIIHIFNFVLWETKRLTVTILVSLQRHVRHT
jgi:hypothetical protein